MRIAYFMVANIHNCEKPENAFRLLTKEEKIVSYHAPSRLYDNIKAMN